MGLAVAAMEAGCNRGVCSKDPPMVDRRTAGVGGQRGRQRTTIRLSHSRPAGAERRKQPATQASGLTPFSSTHTAIPAAMPASSATKEPMKGRLAQPRLASSP